MLKYLEIPGGETKNTEFQIFKKKNKKLILMLK